ncbi:hypothetical protein [Nocardia miyunensis]|nr:hypothetical protein [Nocardia miyunensis]
MTYTDRQHRHIVIFAIVMISLAVVISGMAVVAVLYMHHGHHSAPVSTQ